MPGQLYRKNYQQDRRITRLEKKMKKEAQNEEVKYKIATFSGTIAVAGGVSALNESIAIGATRITRIGQQIRGTSLKLRMQIANATGSPGQNTVVRMIIFWWNDVLPGASIPLLTGNSLTGDDECLLATQGTIAGTAITFLPYSMENNQLYDVIYDKIHILSPQYVYTATPGVAPAIVPLATKIIKVNCKFNRKIEYHGTSGATNTMTGNTLWMALSTDNGTAQPTFVGCSRFCYKDE